MFPLEFRAEVNHQETRVMGLSSSEDRIIVASRFGMIPDCDGRSDGQSDGQTESIMAKTVLCIASYADALSITVTITTRSSATAERQRVSYTRLSRLTH